MPGKRRIDVRLATQILLLQLAVVALTLGIAFALMATVYNRRLVQEYGNRSLDIARVVASAPAVREEVARDNNTMPSVDQLADGYLQRLATQVQQGAHVLFVVSS